MRRRLALLLLALGLTGCGGRLGYLWQAVRGEARILLARRPLAEVLARRDLPPETRRKLRLVARTAEAAERILGLARTRQYREVALLPETTGIWVLSAAARDRLEPHTWWFPIVGEVPYLGFFDRAEADRWAERLGAEEDVYVREAAAYSTLGWLPEPILPAFLRQPEYRLVELVVHELVHATIYRAGESAWNESVATALGQAGAALLLERWGRRAALRRLERAAGDRLLWARLLAEFRAELERTYAALATAPSEVRLAAKARRFAAFRERIRNAPWRGTGYRWVADHPQLNHAFVLAHAVYLADPERQLQWERAARRDFRRAVAELRRRAEGGGGEGLWAPL